MINSNNVIIKFNSNSFYPSHSLKMDGSNRILIDNDVKITIVHSMTVHNLESNQIQQPRLKSSNIQTNDLICYMTFDLLVIIYYLCLLGII